MAIELMQYIVEGLAGMERLGGLIIWNTAIWAN